MSPKRAKRQGRSEDAARQADDASPNGRAPVEGDGGGPARKEGRDQETLIKTLSLWTKAPPRKPLRKTPPKWHNAPPGGGTNPPAGGGGSQAGGHKR